MRTLRTALTVASLSLLCVGYAASQIAYFLGSAPEYAARVDQPPVQRLAAIILLAAVVLAMVKEKPQENPPA